MSGSTNVNGTITRSEDARVPVLGTTGVTSEHALRKDLIYLIRSGDSILLIAVFFTGIRSTKST